MRTTRVKVAASAKAKVRDWSNWIGPFGSRPVQAINSQSRQTAIDAQHQLSAREETSFFWNGRHGLITAIEPIAMS